MGAPIVAYTSVVGTRLQDHLPLSLLRFLSPTEALFASLQNVLFFSLPFSFYFNNKYKAVLFPCQTVFPQICYCSAFGLHSSKNMHTDCENPSLCAWLPRDCLANARQHLAGQWKSELLLSDVPSV